MQYSRVSETVKQSPVMKLMLVILSNEKLEKTF